MPPGAPPPNAKPAGKSKTGLIAGIVGAVVLIVGAAGAYLWLRSAGSNLAKYAPKDTETFVEIPSTTKALANAFLGMDVIDTSKIDSDKQKGEIFDAFASSFDVSKDEAEAFLLAVDGVAMAQRRIERKDEDDFGPSTEGVTLVKMSSASKVEPILKSKRFDADGELAGGKKYVLTRKETDPDKREKLSTFEAAFNDFGDLKKKKGSDDDDDEEKSDKKKKKKGGKVLVWFESEALFAAGEESVVEEVGKLIKDGGESLKDTENFKKAKWDSGSAVLFYMNPEFAKKDDKKDYFNGTGPLVGSVGFHDGGLTMGGRVELKGKRIPKESDLVAEDVSFELYEKLPADTVAYVSFSGKFKADGKALQKALIKAAKTDEDNEREAEQLEEGLEKMEETIGFSFDVLADSIGDEVVMGIVADKKVDVEVLMEAGKDKKAAAQEASEKLGFVAIYDVGDKDKAEKLVKGLRSTIEEKAKDTVEIKKKDGGFLVEPADVLKSLGSIPDFDGGLQITVEKEKHVLIALGSKKRLEAIKAAFDGSADTLAKDGAHKKALDAVGKKGQAFLFIDAGRVGKKLLDQADDMKKELKKKGFDLEAIKLEGDDRLVVAAAVKVGFKDEIMSVEFKSLNAPLLAAAASFGFLRALSRGLDDIDAPPRRPNDDFPPPPPPSGGGGSGPPPTGMPNCDAYLQKMYACADKLGGDAMRKSMVEAANSFKQAASGSPAAKEAVNDSCKKSLEMIPAQCN
jgi:hypothetical protein